MTKPVTNRAIVFWNMMGSLSTAGISVVLLMVVTRFLPLKTADLYSFAYAFSNLMIMISMFQVRNFQSTDIKETYTFENYLLARFLTSLAMLAVVGLYLLWSGFDTYKSAVLIYTCLYRLTDSLSDVYQGFYQQHSRLDLAGKFLVIRNSFIFLIFLLTLVVNKDLLRALQLVCLVSFLLFMTTDVRFSVSVASWHWRNVFTKESLRRSYYLLTQTLPLFINGFLLMYIYNKPKYVLEELARIGSIQAGEQTIFNVLFMPAFVMNLLILFFRPLITQAAIYLANEEGNEFVKTTKRLFLYLSSSTFILMVGLSFFGTSLLSILYSIDVRPYWLSFVILMLGGVFSSFGAALDNIITALRQQHLLIVSYIASFLVCQLLTSNWVEAYGIFGAALSFNLSMLVWALTSTLVYYISYHKYKHRLPNQ